MRNVFKFTVVGFLALVVVLILLYLISLVSTLRATKERGREIWDHIALSDKVIVSDMCLSGSTVYLTAFDKGSIYKIVNDSLVTAFGAYGTGDLKFRSPSAIVRYKDGLVISDAKNLDIQLVDTNGTYEGRFPKRTSDDFHWTTESKLEGGLGGLFVSAQLFGIVVADQESGERLLLYRYGSSDVNQVGEYYASIQSVVFDSTGKMIFLAADLEKMIVSFDVEGVMLNSVGEFSDNPYQFAKIEDMVFENGILYVLNVQDGVSKNSVGSNSVLMFDSSLRLVDSVIIDHTFNIPCAMDVTADGSTLVIVNNHATGLYRVDITKY